MKPVSELYPQINQTLWQPLLFGSSWFNGGICYEYGVEIVTGKSSEFHPGIDVRINLNKPQAEVICAKRHDGISVEYALIDKPGFVWWEGREYTNSRVVRVKHFEMSNWFNKRIFSYDVGPSYLEYDICPLISYCVGNAYYDDSTEMEVFFVCTEGSDFLDQVATYYQLPIPYGDNHVHTLNTNPKLYRAGHFDIFRLGPGKFHPLVLASIVFKEKKPIRLLFHTFQRPWEFESSLDVDYF
jgi:hypothetical protein